MNTQSRSGPTSHVCSCQKEETNLTIRMEVKDKYLIQKRGGKFLAHLRFVAQKASHQVYSTQDAEEKIEHESCTQGMM